MPFRNRVDPFGTIHAVGARGLFTGNRGVIHDPDTRRLSGRRWTTRAWIVCHCGYRNLKRDVMGRNARSGTAGWTNLFFLDEVTALAAGHRPCFTCRRSAARRFAASFAEGNGLPTAPAPVIDRRLHAERQGSGAGPVSMDETAVAGLPDGAMVALAGLAYAVARRRLLPWTFEGYGPPVAMPLAEPGDVTLLTPPSTVAALRAGYRPIWHETATGSYPTDGSAEASDRA